MMQANQREQGEQGAPESATGVDQPAVRRPGSRGPLPGTESARKGGLALRVRYGEAHFARMEAKGGQRVRDERGPAFYAQIGRLGGSATRDRHGLEYYSRIGRQGGLRRGTGKRTRGEAETGAAGR
jgi:hypothetical protein